VKVTGVDVVTALVPMPKLALVAPCGTVTLLVPGPAATVPSLDVTETGNPPAGAALVIVTVPTDCAGPWTLAGFTTNAESAIGGVTVRTALAPAPP
jgi:hypothetical protein